MGLFNRQVKKKPENGNGKPAANGNGTNGHGTNGHDAEAPAPNAETGAELFEVKTSESMGDRAGNALREKSPHAIKSLMPWIDRARSGPEGRTEFIEKTKEVAWQQADNTVRAISAGMGIADTRAFFRGDPPVEKPNPRYKVHVNAFFAHLRPKYYEKASTKFSHTFALGYLSVYMFLLETLTGVILMVFYTPSDRRAYEDIIKIMSAIPFGQLMRDIHRVGAELMVLIVVLHMTRVFLTGSFKPPARGFTWLTGVILLILTFALSFSGYLLPWDQLAYWAVTIGTSMAKSVPPKEIVGYYSNLIMRGGDTINQNGLLRFYLMHVFGLPAITLVLISVHYYRVARSHGISLPAGEEEDPDPAVRKAAKERMLMVKIRGFMEDRDALAAAAYCLAAMHEPQLTQGDVDPRLLPQGKEPAGTALFSFMCFDGDVGTLRQIADGMLKTHPFDVEAARAKAIKEAAKWSQ